MERYYRFEGNNNEILLVTACLSDFKRDFQQLIGDQRSNQWITKGLWLQILF
jgi:hypothetical protein